MPDQFWSLTYREFGLKFEAFSREQDRQRALAFESGLVANPHMGKRQRAHIERAINQLRRYPLKQWLLPPADPQ